MNLKQAQYIQTIAREGGVTAAARKLRISQPSLSQMLRQIEGELGVELFDRGSQPLRPTYAGECYLQAARVMLDASRQLDEQLRQIRQEEGGVLRLGVSIQRLEHLLPRVLPGFYAQFPHVTVRLREAGSADLEQLVLEGEVDLALASTEAVLPGLDYQLLQPESIGILAGEHSALAQTLPTGTAISLDQALDSPFISLKPGHSIRIIQDRLFRELGRRPEILLETDSMAGARRLTLACGCHMLCSDSYLAPGEAFYPLRGYENRRHFYACTRKDPVLPRYQRAFLDLVRAALLPR